MSQVKKLLDEELSIENPEDLYYRKKKPSEFEVECMSSADYLDYAFKSKKKVPNPNIIVKEGFKIKEVMTEEEVGLHKQSLENELLERRYYA